MQHRLGRRTFLGHATAVATLPIFAGCSAPGGTSETASDSGGSSSGDADASSSSDGGAGMGDPPQRLHTTVVQQPDGTYLRTFAGVSAPQDLVFVDDDGASLRILDAFPRAHCPFAIDTARELGDGGYALAVVDRTLAGERPDDGARWPLSMVPFGVAIDGVILDPSGPWYDGGPADPDNPFDRGCSGWEYDPIFPTVADLVGVPAALRGHVQPGPGGMFGSAGQFHYHGVPAVMLAALRAWIGDTNSALVVGYAADGWWIIDAVVPGSATDDGVAIHLFSGYVLRTGPRTAVEHTNPSLVPAGAYDGTFVADWIHDPQAKRALIEAALAADGSYLGLTAADVAAGRARYRILDARNGLASDDFVVADAPTGAYLYVLTPDWPEIPRYFGAEPSSSFRTHVIPLVGGGMGPPGRQQLYDGCNDVADDVHPWAGQDPF